MKNKTIYFIMRNSFVHEVQEGIIIEYYTGDDNSEQILVKHLGTHRLINKEDLLSEADAEKYKRYNELKEKISKLTLELNEIQNEFTLP